MTTYQLDPIRLIFLQTTFYSSCLNRQQSHDAQPITIASKIQKGWTGLGLQHSKLTYNN